MALSGTLGFKMRRTCVHAMNASHWASWTLHRKKCTLRSSRDPLWELWIRKRTQSKHCAQYAHLPRLNIRWHIFAWPREWWWKGRTFCLLLHALFHCRMVVILYRSDSSGCLSERLVCLFSKMWKLICFRWYANTVNSRFLKVEVQLNLLIFQSKCSGPRKCTC